MALRALQQPSCCFGTSNSYRVAFSPLLTLAKTQGVATHRFVSSRRLLAQPYLDQQAHKYRQTRSISDSTKSYRPQTAAPSTVKPSTSSYNGNGNGNAKPQSTVVHKHKPDVPDLSGGLSDGLLVLDEGTNHVDWSRSFHGLSSEPFPKEVADILLQPLAPDDVEIKPDGIVYLPEIKYRRILNKAFGPGGWGLAPRGETIVTAKAVTREYALVAHGRLVSVARGEQDYFSPDSIPTATEGCKSNAMMRCCKDLGVASELWDPKFIRQFKAKHAREAFVEHMVNKRKTKIWLRKDDEVKYPFKESR
ncbi:MAG: hypothetical protein M1834_006656 [Cirrosporium novae-zelandiae]|nr:MAG: hypothetical protein M1834_006656 [Cirrosporium novae-zelandiae]